MKNYNKIGQVLWARADTHMCILSLRAHFAWSGPITHNVINKRLNDHGNSKIAQFPKNFNRHPLISVTKEWEKRRFCFSFISYVWVIIIIFIFIALSIDRFDVMIFKIIPKTHTQLTLYKGNNIGYFVMLCCIDEFIRMLKPNSKMTKNNMSFDSLSFINRKSHKNHKRLRIAHINPIYLQN